MSNQFITSLFLIYVKLVNFYQLPMRGERIAVHIYYCYCYCCYWETNEKTLRQWRREQTCRRKFDASIGIYSGDHLPTEGTSQLTNQPASQVVNDHSMSPWRLKQGPAVQSGSVPVSTIWLFDIAWLILAKIKKLYVTHAHRSPSRTFEAQRWTNYSSL